jgi:hypothetical protein
MKRPARTPSQLSESLHRRLNAYALAASAAGVGIAALAQPADARIVYTKTHEQILGQRERLELDLNHDGINDFFFEEMDSAHFTFRLSMYTKFLQNRIWGNASSKYGMRLASALPPGVQIGPSKHFSVGFRGTSGNSWGKVMYKAQVCGTQTKTCTTHRFGQWGGKEKNRYLGLEFRIKGKRHYGWAKVSYISSYYTLTGYAYETIPNKPIRAGQTHGRDEATLGRLARGASSVRQKQ